LNNIDIFQFFMLWPWSNSRCRQITVCQCCRRQRSSANEKLRPLNFTFQIIRDVLQVHMEELRRMWNPNLKWILQFFI